MIKGKFIGTAVLCAAMLAGCGNVPDLTKKYKDNLDYTLGEYSVGEPDAPSDKVLNWDITFTDKNNVEQTAQLWSFEYDDYKKESYGSKNEAMKDDLFTFYCRCMYYIAKAELWNDVMSEYFDVDFAPHALTLYSDEVAIDISISPAVLVLTSEKASEMIEREISPENGIKLSDEDLRSVVAKDYMTTIVRVVVNDGIDPAPYIEKMKAAITEFEEYEPMNYVFEVMDNDINIYFGKYIVLGEEKQRTDFVEDGRNLLSMSGPVTEALGYNDKE